MIVDRDVRFGVGNVWVGGKDGVQGGLKECVHANRALGAPNSTRGGM